MSADPPSNELDITLRRFVSGQKLFRRYTLIKILGQGGMGVVWLARDEELELQVALKFLPSLVAHDRALLSDLKRETRRSLELTHNNIVRIYDFVQDEQSACISMEYVDGYTLSELRVEKEAEVFQPSELVSWIRQACDALEFAHQHARVVHCDIKPSNLMVNSKGTLKIADFGIARSLSDSVSVLTMKRSTTGTLVFMSPQQLDGEGASRLDDIYSLGATLFDLLTGKPPFYRGQIDRQIRERTPPSVTIRRAELDIVGGEPIPAHWEDIIAACLAKDPTKRPQNAINVAERLESGSIGYGKVRPIAVDTRATSPGPQSTSAALSKEKRHPKSIAIAAICLLVLAVGGGVALYFVFPTTDATRSPTNHPQSPILNPEGLVKTGPPSPSVAQKSPSAEVPSTAEFSKEASEQRDRAVAVSPLDAGDTRNDADGIPDGSTFGITEVTATDSPDADSETNMKLKIAVKARPGTVVDHTKVKIQVFFYDTLDNKEVLLTDADVSYEWLTPHHDWKNTNPEVLAVTYLRPKNKPTSSNGALSAAAVTPPGSSKKKISTELSKEGAHRTYLGYIIRVYYNEQLQAVRANPTKLLNLFPPPFTAPSK